MLSDDQYERIRSFLPGKASDPARDPLAKIWHSIFAELVGDAEFEEVFIDSTIVRVYQHAAGSPKKTVTSRLGVLAED